MKLCFHVPKQACKNQGASCLSACFEQSELNWTAMCPLRVLKSTYLLQWVSSLEERCYKITSAQCSCGLLFGPLFNLISLNNRKRKSSFSVLANKTASATSLQNMAAQERHTVKILLNSDLQNQGCIVHLFQSIWPCTQASGFSWWKAWSKT